MTSTRSLRIAVGTCVLALIAAGFVAADGAKWHEDFAVGTEAAATSERPILAAFHSVGCGPCARLEEETLGHPEVAGVIARRFEAVRINAMTQPEVATRYMVSAFPTVKFMDADGTVVHDVRGFVATEDFLGVMKRGLDAHAALQRARAAAAAAEAEPLDDAADMLAIARDFYAARQYQPAADWAAKAAEIADAESAPLAEAQYLLGAALTEAGEPGRALQPLVDALRIADGAGWQWDACLKLGYVWLQRGEADSGIGMLQRVHVSEEASAEVRAEAERLLRWWGVDLD